jgi:hypothetical protein
MNEIGGESEPIPSERHFPHVYLGGQTKTTPHLKKIKCGKLQ